jgi:hypothetical protein
MTHNVDEELQAQTARVQEILERVQERLTTSDQPGALAQIQLAENGLPLEAEFEPLRARVALEKEKILKGMNQSEIQEAIHAAYQNDDFENVLVLETYLFKSSPAPAAVTHRVNAARRMAKIIQAAVERADRDLESGDWFSAFARLAEELRKFSANPLLESSLLRVGLVQGEKEIAAGLTSLQGRKFSEAQRRGETAAQVFTKILERYPAQANLKAGWLRAQNLVDVSTQLLRVEADWAAARHAEAMDGLIRTLPGAGSPVVTQTIEALIIALQAEIEQIQEQEATFRDGERYLKEKKLKEATRCYQQLNASISPQLRAFAARRLAEIEERIAEFNDLLNKAQGASHPEQSVAELTRAHEIWPSGPGSREKLIQALLSTAHACWAHGETQKMIFYAHCVLVLDENCQEAQELEKMPEVKERGEALLMRSRQELDGLRAQPLNATAAAFQELSGRLKRVLTLSARLPELRLTLEHRLAEVDQAMLAWQQFKEEYEAALAAQQAGQWDEAVEKLRGAVQVYGDPAWQVLQDQLKHWERIAETLRQAQEEMQTALQQVNGLYPTLEQPSEAELALEHLASGLTAAKNAQRALKEWGVAELPPTARDLQERLAQIQTRLRLIANALQKGAAYPQRLKIAAALRQDPGDNLLQTLHAQLQQREKAEIDAHFEQARQAIRQENFAEALECYRRARAVRPEDEELGREVNALEQRLNLEKTLRQLENEADHPIAGANDTSARDILQSALQCLIAEEGLLLPEVRAILIEMIDLSERDDGQALADPELWAQVEDQILELGHLSQDWGSQRAHDLAQKWARQTRLAALQARVQAAQQTHDLRGQYRALRALLRCDPFNHDYARDCQQTGQALVSATHTAAAHCLTQAEDLLQQGQFLQAISDLSGVEDELYGELAHEFPELWDDQEQAAQNRQRAQTLLREAEQLQLIEQTASPIFTRVQVLCAANAIESAEELMAQVTVDLKGLPFLQKIQRDLLKQIRATKIELARGEFNRALHACENDWIAARDDEDFAGLVEKIEQIKQQTYFELLDAKDHRRLNLLLSRAHKKRAELARGIEDERSAREFLALNPPDYIAAEWAFKRALEVALDGQRQAVLRRELDRISKDIQQQRGREAALKRGREALTDEQYKLARSEFMRAQRNGANVDLWLKIVKAGLQLEKIQLDHPNAEAELQECLELIAEMDVPEAEQLREIVQGRLKMTGESL